MFDKKCSVVGCDRRDKKLPCGMCGLHYQRWKKYGDPLVNNRRIARISNHSLYGAFCGMLNRCSNPNHSSYHQYGARGIYVCDRWRAPEGFLVFLADMGERPDGMTLDRIDPKGPYNPENCRWATHHEQRMNQSPEGSARQRQAASRAATKKWEKFREQKDAANVR